MPARKLLPLFLFAALGLTEITGCGGNSQSAGLPQGNFTNANLNGTYAFAFSGQNLNTGVFFTMAGSLQANGSGTITGGTIDVNSPSSTPAIVTNSPLTGTYIVHADGRGSATLTSSGLPNNVSIDFVLLSNQHGAVIRFDNLATASGSLDLQNSSAFSLPSLAGSLVFNVGGLDGSGAALDSVGVFTVDASGNLSAGVQDTSDDGAVTRNETLAAAAGAMAAPSSGNGRGTLAISSATTTRHYAYYVVSTTQIRMIGIDSATILQGDAFRQSTTAITGPFAFTVSGSAAGNPFVAGGILNIDAAGDHGNSVEDTNTSTTAGSAPNLNVGLSGAFTAVTGGRSALSLTTTSNTTVTYAAYPSSGGLQVLRTDNAFVVAGTAFQQTGSFSNSTINGRYGASITGVAFNGLNFLEFDAVYQLSGNGAGQLTGAQDINSAGTLATNLAVHGTFALGSDGRSTSLGSLNTSAANLGVIYYAVDSTHILFIEADNANDAVAVGALSQQQ